ncbi:MULTISPECIES: 2-oxoglutarate dehydrogenase E1 component [unclassified Arcicella]|uniref:2-oxoglutarate dehydrogenase E1 component n=1 Tax=unclassified Arcicella TaxID=2644986 RepID=UPI0028589EBB|nr:MULTISPECIES: 2-oxoglutarate dehydrogenase E1 component [unclassified Arcicella]MDR6560152.1 2-oxoglutarate dehydrogenase E1 component [Arcicella sp. BE51]MDR6810241.1 2-oxoglutarate dehydrogenase E1 component [Arcicella sp. BE140]MDR6821591.1 2-oxoglutarate dehydrogenase E1 component [Arcicella sp. BE139]
MDQFSYIANADTAAISDLYESYSKDPNSVDTSWQNFFKGFDFHANWSDSEGVANGIKSEGISSPDTSNVQKEMAVISLIKAFRSRGHLLAKTNPIRNRKNRQPRLDLKDYSLSEADLDTNFQAGNFLGIGAVSLRKILESLNKIYAGSIGFEYAYIREPEVKEWLRTKIEREALSFNPSIDEKKQILTKLNEAVVFENFLGTKYLGQKRFGLEGGESTIPALDAIINRSAELGVKEAMIGMAHRGRLNVLANIMHKSYDAIFDGFEGNLPDQIHGDGDVKYHLGYSSKHISPSGVEISLKLAPNPSHLEAVNPLVEGFCRARADAHYEGDYDKILPILIHGDAAVAGQGIVYEVTQMAKLKGYEVGGTIHFVINNQVGFTTDFEDARSSIYCTDVAKIIDAPVFHVNGDDPEAVVFVSKMAAEFRQQFNRDVFIDMVCYRRNGHNESDEPRFTQPTLYANITNHLNPRELYTQKLIARGDIDAKLASEMDSEFKSELQARLDLVKQKIRPEYHPLKLDNRWAELRYANLADFDNSPKTSISKEAIDKIAASLSKLPAGFTALKQIEKVLADRKGFFENGILNWATAEALAYGSLLLEGKPVRVSGQDVQRGTFSHRHAVLHDANTNESYTSLNYIEEGQEQLQIFNSLLSEYAVLGFEFGYALANPDTLVIWEAQFGDFSNGAQTMIDQFIASCESKWGTMNGLVMQLPHGYEGQGPEHSNARPERYLQLAAEENIVVTNLTTPANLFHALRRQLAWEFRKPLVMMSPKSLFRHPKVVSPISDFTDGKFEEVYGDTFVEAKKVKKVLLCSGKVYFDLLDKQAKDNRTDVAIIRVEQLQPFPTTKVQAEIDKYPKAKVYWVQEEPENMGYWSFVIREFGWKPFEGLVARKKSASPATGFLKVHNEEQAALIERAFA